MALLSTSKVFDGGALALQLGGELSHLEMAYETYGTLADDAANAVLICHGYTSNPNAAGWWSGLIGPGKALDTDRWFIVCCNMLGSAYGSSGPPSMNPDTGKPYGPDFPQLTLADMASAQDRVLRSLGIEQLAAIVGYSFGGQLALQWAVSNPTRMKCLVVVASGLRSRNGAESVSALEQRFASCAGWNGGHYLDGADNERDIRRELRDIRLATLRHSLGNFARLRLRAPCKRPPQRRGASRATNARGNDQMGQRIRCQRAHHLAPGERSLRRDAAGRQHPCTFALCAVTH